MPAAASLGPCVESLLAGQPGPPLTPWADCASVSGHARQLRPDDIYRIQLVARMLLLCSQFATGVALVTHFALPCAEMSASYKLLAAAQTPAGPAYSPPIADFGTRRANFKIHFAIVRIVFINLQISSLERRP